MEKTMKITNLSVGDWVLFAGFPRRVRLVCSTFVLPHNGVLDIATFSIDDISPIPITPEILEKNGFVKRDTYIWNNPKMRCTAYRFGRKYWDVRVTYRARDYRPTRITIDNILYVHELQHALRLAGVEKELELWES